VKRQTGSRLMRHAHTAAAVTGIGEITGGCAVQTGHAGSQQHCEEKQQLQQDEYDRMPSVAAGVLW
jgi:hypothetical protein